MTTSKHLLQNYAYDLRGFDGSGQKLPSVPRTNFSFFVEFGFNQAIGSDDTPSTDTAQDLDNLLNKGNSILVKTFSKPGFAFDTEKLRSYNKVYNLKKKIEYNDLSLTLYDDSRSFVRYMIEQYRRHYNNHGAPSTNTGEETDISRAGRMGVDGLPLNRPLDNQENGIRSMGMRLHDEPRKQFFDYIKLYDLGTDPNAAQIYTIYNPIIKSVDNVNLDYTDGSGYQEVSLNLEYTYFDTSVFNDTGELHSAEGLFQTHLNKAIIEDHRTVNYDPKKGSQFDDFLPDSVNDFLNGIGVTPGELIQAVQNSIQGGELNMSDLRRNIFETVASGTPIQNIRLVIQNIRLIEQAITQGRFTDILPLIGEAGAQLGNVKNFDPFGLDETAKNVKDTIKTNIGNGTWLSKHLNPKV